MRRNQALAVLSILFLAIAGTGSAFSGYQAPRTSAASIQRAATVLADDWEQVPSGSGTGASPHTTASASLGPSAGNRQRGAVNAPVTIIEYSDFQCPYCQQAETTLQHVRQHYGDRVRLIYMDNPLGSHPDAMNAALAARCADEQGRFWEYHDALFAQAGQLSIISLELLADRLGLDTTTFDSCLSERKYESSVQADAAEGVRSGAAGTPFFFIDGRPLAGAPSYPSLEQLIDYELSRRG